MDLFGSGFLFITQVADASGNVPANPTPLLVGIMQELSLNVKNDLKELFGQSQDAVDVARGKRKITGKVKHAKITALLWDTALFGVGLTAGLVGQLAATASAAIPTTPFTITPTVPSSGTFATDLGVIGTNGVEFTKVASAPATGQYAVNVGTGVYTFAAADTGKLVYINFGYTASVTGAFKQDIPNLPMGYTPLFAVNFNCQHQAKQLTINMPRCATAGMDMSFKNEDFTIPEMDFQAFFDPTTGKTLTASYTE